MDGFLKLYQRQVETEDSNDVQRETQQRTEGSKSSSSALHVVCAGDKLFGR